MYSHSSDTKVYKVAIKIERCKLTGVLFLHFARDTGI